MEMVVIIGQLKALEIRNCKLKLFDLRKTKNRMCMIENAKISLCATLIKINLPFDIMFDQQQHFFVRVCSLHTCIVCIQQDDKETYHQWS